MLTYRYTDISADIRIHKHMQTDKQTMRKIPYKKTLEIYVNHIFWADNLPKWLPMTSWSFNTRDAEVPLYKQTHNIDEHTGWHTVTTRYRQIKVSINTHEDVKRYTHADIEPNGSVRIQAQKLRERGQGKGLQIFVTRSLAMFISLN